MMERDLTSRVHARDQYLTTSTLHLRSAVWQPGPDGVTPQDLAIEALADASSVLEVGCGTGELSLAIGERMGSIPTCCDLSPAMAAAASARGLRAAVADVRQLPFADASFDGVLAAWVLFHVADVSVALRECARILSPNGVFVAITNGEAHLRELWAAAETTLAALSFSRENGRRLLEGVFDSVEQHDLASRAVFADRDAAAAYAATVAPDAALNLPELPRGLTATGTPTVFVARKARS